jgi:predicted restriction endonuclease
MNIIKDFAAWMKENSTLSDSSIYKYSRAVNTVSNDMIEKGIISESLLTMSNILLDRAIVVILKDADFIQKNSTGNNMYSNSLKQYRNFLAVNDARQLDTVYEKFIDDRKITETERTSIIKSRIGQGIFREKLIEKYNGCCVVTGVNDTRFLLASHIRPWAVSTNEERICEDNGLLLSATYDRLFDSGLISFTWDGKMIISRFVTEVNRQKLKIASGEKYNLLCNSQMKTFLEYHNDVVFIK